jgi:hypothetical protein
MGIPSVPEVKLHVARAHGEPAREQIARRKKHEAPDAFASSGPAKMGPWLGGADNCPLPI